MTARLSKTLLSPLIFLIATPVQGGSTAGALAIVHFGSEGDSGLFLSALKPPRRVPDSTHLDHTAREHWIDRHAPYSPVRRPSAQLQPSPVGRVVARSILLF